MYRLELEVVQVMGKCDAYYGIGDKTVIDDATIDLKKSTKVCLYALSSLMTYLASLKGIVRQRLDEQGY
jgi:uncharacterized repeat protein (TIGR04076 family)